jgi:hypothetical protein
VGNLVQPPIVSVVVALPLLTARNSPGPRRQTSPVPDAAPVDETPSFKQPASESRQKPQARTQPSPLVWASPILCQWAGHRELSAARDIVKSCGLAGGYSERPRPRAALEPTLPVPAAAVEARTRLRSPNCGRRVHAPCSGLMLPACAGILWRTAPSAFPESSSQRRLLADIRRCRSRVRRWRSWGVTAECSRALEPSRLHRDAWQLALERPAHATGTSTRSSPPASATTPLSRLARRAPWRRATANRWASVTCL